MNGQWTNVRTSPEKRGRDERRRSMHPARRLRTRAVSEAGELVRRDEHTRGGIADSTFRNHIDLFEKRYVMCGGFVRTRDLRETVAHGNNPQTDATLLSAN